MLAAAALICLAVRPCAGQEARRVEDAAQETLAASEMTDLSKLLPAPGEIPGWHLDGEALTYTEDYLWEYIDGSAENFLAFKFRQVLAQDYVSTGREGLKVEIYEHESPLMAYGIYAQMRSPGIALREIGNEAFADEYSISFWKDRFFVRVAVFEAGVGLETAMETFAKAIAAKISEGGELPAEARVFPDEGLMPNDVRYLTQGVLGREKFPPAFVGTYAIGDEEAKLYLSTLADSAAARDTFLWYTDGLESFHATAEGPEGNYILGQGTDPFQGDIIAFNVGRYLGVLEGLKAPAERGVDLVKKMVERLGALDADRKKAPAPEPAKK